MKVVDTEKAPKAIGPYSQAIVAGDFVFCSGQIAIDPLTGEMIAGGIEEQTGRVLENLEAVLGEARMGLGSVTSVTIYLKNLSDFKEMNGVYEKKFGNHRPARETAGVCGLPKHALVEMSCIAHLST